MDSLKFNPNSTKKVPINRNNLFYSQESFDFDMGIGKNYIEQDMNQSVVLFEVDLEKTNLNSVYKESDKKNLVFKIPRQISCVYEIAEGELRSYDKNKNMGTYVKTGNLKMGVYQATLDEVGCEIKNGDYIGVQITNEHMEYFVVVNDGRNNYSNSMTNFGYKPFYRHIEAVSTTIEKDAFE